MAAGRAPTITAVSDDSAAAAAGSGSSKVVLGVCGMGRKVHSKPMRAILDRVTDLYGKWLSINVFDERTILEEGVDKWPRCDALLSFYASDFPLHKAVTYAKRYRPFVINDPDMQYTLLDRPKVYSMLRKHGIDQPRHAILIRDEKYGPVYAVGPSYAHAEARKSPALDGKVDRDSHGKEIRYPVILSNKEKMIARKIVMAFGQTVCGFDLLRARGCSYVVDVNGFSFVKTSNKYYDDTARILGNMVLRRTLQTLSVRAAPVPAWYQADDPPLVETSTGKVMELRCVIAVIRHGDRTPKQKIKLHVTDQRFIDLFETEGGRKAPNREIKMKKPKQLTAVLEIARQILSEGELKKKQLRDQVQQEKALMGAGCSDGEMDDSGSLPAKTTAGAPAAATSGRLHESRKSVAEGSDADKVPVDGHKQKSKSDSRFTPSEKELCKLEDDLAKLQQVKCVLEMYGYFSGINRKVQLKQLRAGSGYGSGGVPGGSESESAVTTDDGNATPTRPQTMLLLVVKWGGELTEAGVMQAEALGKLFRTLYPGIRGGQRDDDKRGLGFLRLHSTYRHDLKIYASDEGRVQMTAAAFTKGLLALEGELPPILVQMVKSANTDGLLDDDANARHFQSELKESLHAWLQLDRELTCEDIHCLNPTKRKSIQEALEFIKHPRRMCDEIWTHVHRLCGVIQDYKRRRPRHVFYQNETLDMAERRWGKLLRDFRHSRKSGTVCFDISKIPDIYDNIKYDMEHNPELSFDREEEFERMYMCVKNMADVLVPLEYGIKNDGKLTIAQGICTPLMKKLQTDLRRCVENEHDDEQTMTRLDPKASEGISTPLRHVRTRLYFTSESHIHTLMNLIQHGGLEIDPNDRKWQRAMNFLSTVTEFNYMTQLVIMLYEDMQTGKDAAGTSSNSSATGKDSAGESKNFHVELLFSPGLYPCFLTEKERIYETRVGPGHTMSDSLDAPRPQPPAGSAGGTAQITRELSSLNEASDSGETTDQGEKGGEKRGSREGRTSKTSKSNKKASISRSNTRTGSADEHDGAAADAIDTSDRASKAATKSSLSAASQLLSAPIAGQMSSSTSGSLSDRPSDPITTTTSATDYKRTWSRSSQAPLPQQSAALSCCSRGHPSSCGGGKGGCASESCELSDSDTEPDEVDCGASDGENSSQAEDDSYTQSATHVNLVSLGEVHKAPQFSEPLHVVLRAAKGQAPAEVAQTSPRSSPPPSAATSTPTPGKDTKGRAASLDTPILAACPLQHAHKCKPAGGRLRKSHSYASCVSSSRVCTELHAAHSHGGATAAEVDSSALAGRQLLLPPSRDESDRRHGKPEKCDKPRQRAQSGSDTPKSAVVSSASYSVPTVSKTKDTVVKVTKKHSHDNGVAYYRSFSHSPMDAVKVSRVSILDVEEPASDKPLPDSATGDGNEGRAVARTHRSSVGSNDPAGGVAHPHSFSAVAAARRLTPYRFKHHTVNLLRDGDNRLISTAVITGGSPNASNSTESRRSADASSTSTMTPGYGASDFVQSAPVSGDSRESTPSRISVASANAALVGNSGAAATQTTGCHVHSPSPILHRPLAPQHAPGGFAMTQVASAPGAIGAAAAAQQSAAIGGSQPNGGAGGLHDQLQTLNANLTGSTQTIAEEDGQAIEYGQHAHDANCADAEHRLDPCHGQQQNGRRASGTAGTQPHASYATSNAASTSTWHYGAVPVVLSTAIIGRSSSAPKLDMTEANNVIPFTEIKRFWPPLRSLETLHDNLAFLVFDRFLSRVTTVRTPVPSPPKTPKEMISRENSDLNPDAAHILSVTRTDSTPKPSQGD